MRAAIFERYGAPEVLKVVDLPKPTPKENEILIKICAASVSSGDCRIRALDVPKGMGLPVRLVFGINKPRKKILGMNLAGVVEAVGEKVTAYKVGDKVMGSSGMAFGAYAEYKCVSEKAPITLMPDHLSYEEAASITFGALTALHYIRNKAQVKNGDRVLINGASGAVGVSSIQMAKSLGAHVTAVCSGKNAEFVKSIGADDVIDYQKESIFLCQKNFDVVMDTVGNLDFSETKDILSPKGLFLAVSGDLPKMLRAVWTSLFEKQKLIAGVAADTKQAVELVKEFTQSNVFKPVIDQSFSLDRIVDAHRYVDSKRKRGNVILRICDS